MFQFEFERYSMKQIIMETPTKTNNPQLLNNEQCKTPLTSGKKLRKIATDQYAVNREIIEDLKNYAPLINIMPQSSKREGSCKQDSEKYQIQDTIEIVKERDMRIKLRCNFLFERHNLEELAQVEGRCLLNQFKREESRKMNNLNIILPDKTRRQQISNNYKIRILIKSNGDQEYQLHKHTKEIREWTNQSVEGRNKIQFLQQTQNVKVEVLIKQKKRVAQMMQKMAKQHNTYKGLRENVQIKEKDIKELILQIAILKMQINPYIRVNFTTILQNEEEKKYLLEKTSIRWQLKNCKTLKQDEFRFFIIIQLYQSWRRILSRLSYNFEGFKQIFFIDNEHSEKRVPQIENYIVSSKYKGRTTISKLRSIIAVYSPLNEKFTQIVALIKSLIGLENGIIKILGVDFQETSIVNTQDITIRYLYMGQERVKKIELIRIQELTREVISRLLPRHGDKVALLHIDVPMIMSSPAEKYRYEQIYDLIRKEK